jgi:hypothetical protein
MKLLLENWRKYVAEAEHLDRFGYLYIFESNDTKKISFYDALHLLSESSGDVEVFLERWERSVDFTLHQLNEQYTFTGVESIDDALLKVSTQAYLALVTLKDKSIASVLRVVEKINALKRKYPKRAKALKTIVLSLLSGATAYGMYKIVQAGGDASAVQELGQAVADIDPGLGGEIADLSQNFTPEAAANLVADQEQVVSQAAETLGNASDAGLQQVGQSAEQLSQDLSGPESHDANWFRDMMEHGTERVRNTVAQVTTALEEISTSLKEKIGLDVRMGSKFLAGSETEMTNEALTAEQLEFLTDVVREVTEDGTKDQASVHYNHWDAAAETQTTSDFYTTPEGTDTRVCYDAMDAGEPMPGFCLGQVNPADILSSDMAIQFKRTLGQATVTQISDGVYEITDFYDFEGTDASVVGEIVEAVKDLVDRENDQKAYTIIHRIFQMRHKTGYEGFPVRLVVDLSSQGGRV